MRVQSIWTAIQVRYPACDGFLCLPRQVPMREMHRVAKFHHIAQKIRPMTEALQNAGHFLASGFRAPLLVDLGDIARRVHIFNQPYL